MLLHEQGRRHEHGDLFGVLHRFECRAQRDFGLAEPHVAANEPVHRNRLFHVGLHVVDCGELVGGLLIRERVFELFLPRRVFAEGEPFRLLACRIQLDEVLGDLMDVFLRLGLRLRPV